jgi:hypothetical protein
VSPPAANGSGAGIAPCRLIAEAAIATRGVVFDRRPGAGGTGVVCRGGCGVVVVEERRPGIDEPLDVCASVTISSSSAKFRSGSHSSNPSRQTSESPSTAPVPAFSRMAASRIGPTGTPAMPTYQSSPGVETFELCGIGAGRSSTDRLNARAIVLTGSAETGTADAGA